MRYATTCYQNKVKKFTVIIVSTKTSINVAINLKENFTLLVM